MCNLRVDQSSRPGNEGIENLNLFMSVIPILTNNDLILVR